MVVPVLLLGESFVEAVIEVPVVGKDDMATNIPKLPHVSGAIPRQEPAWDHIRSPPG